MGYFHTQFEPVLLCPVAEKLANLECCPIQVHPLYINRLNFVLMILKIFVCNAQLTGMLYSIQRFNAALLP